MSTEVDIETLKYPIGKFKAPEHFTMEEIQKWIHEIASLPARVSAATSQLEHIQLDTPYREGGWTIKQVVHHLADSHMNAFTRFKLAMTEDNPTIKPYKESLWAELTDAKDIDIKYSVQLLEALHHRLMILLHSMKEEDFNRTYYHPEQKKDVTLKHITGMYAWHGNHHLAQINSLKQRMEW